MPSIIDKILHRKSRSRSNLNSPTAPDLTNPTKSSLSKRASLPATPRNNLTSPSAPQLRKSLDNPSRREAIANHSRHAPPPPNPETIMIESQNDSSNHRHDAFNSLFDETRTSASNGVHGAADSNGVNLDRQLPPLPHTNSTGSHEVKAVEGWRNRPSLASGTNRQSVEGELGRDSSDMVSKFSDTKSADGHGAYVGDRGNDIKEEEFDGKRGDVDVPLRGPSLTPVPVLADTGLERKMAGLNIRDHTLDAQRREMVMRLFEESAQRRKERGELTEEGVRLFEKAGMKDRIGKEDTVDITTKWLKPVIQETIINKIHTIYTTIVTTEIHHHHIHPKILPIEDPDPMVLPPLHRIFSPVTGKWHEVEGDEAAIEILGEDVFLNGPKEVRQVRQPYDEDAATRAEKQKSTQSSSLLEGILKPLEGRDLTEEGFGTGGKGKVIEREGVGKEMGDWKDVPRGIFFGHKFGHNKGEEGTEAGDRTGVAM